LDLFDYLPALRGGGTAFMNDFGVLVGCFWMGLLVDFLGGGELRDGEEGGEDEEEPKLEEHCIGGC